jgi:AP-1 complex subunit mu
MVRICINELYPKKQKSSDPILTEFSNFLDDMDKKPPISVKFEIPYFTMSGIQVRYLKIVEKSGYQALPWVRYITQNGDYHWRMPEAVKSGNRIMQPL